MEITKVVKPFIRRGWPNTFDNIVYIICIYLVIKINYWNQVEMNIRIKLLQLLKI